MGLYVGLIFYTAVGAMVSLLKKKNLLVTWRLQSWNVFTPGSVTKFKIYCVLSLWFEHIRVHFKWQGKENNCKNRTESLQSGCIFEMDYKFINQTYGLAGVNKYILLMKAIFYQIISGNIYFFK